jgi:hypothetical protein
MYGWIVSDVGHELCSVVCDSKSQPIRGEQQADSGQGTTEIKNAVQSSNRHV